MSKKQEKKVKPVVAVKSPWLENYDRRLIEASNSGKGCGQCINGRVQFSQDSSSIPCGFCDRA